MRKITAILLFIFLASCANYSVLQQKQSAVSVNVFCAKGGFSGSGVIISNKYVITAKHVLKCKDELRTIHVKTFDGEVFEAVFDKEVQDDVARLFVTSSDFRNSVFLTETVSVGDTVCAVFPRRGYKQFCGAVTKKFTDRIHAKISGEFGDSGSPLFDEDGRIVGILVTRYGEFVTAVPVWVWKTLEVTSEPNVFGVWP